MAGVTIRTFHLYYKIGLLKPAIIGANRYRYNEERQLLHPQQILFFKDIGFALSDISKLLAASDFDNINALKTHKKMVEDEILRKHDLINTIDKTIEHLEGRNVMQDKDLYYGFDSKRKKESEQYLVRYS
ncbi:MAG: MerR family transcriptional regulator [Candidatus Jidaibacter sp.]|jgi:DNA-binding transcriptional MerR regulator|nr:MerR family transcriptional regulator [Candidatus Jidaibacter sp.]